MGNEISTTNDYEDVNSNVTIGYGSKELDFLK